MSNRVLKKLHGGKDDITALASNLQLSDEEADVPLPVSRGSKKKPAVNMFDLVMLSSFISYSYLNFLFASS